MMGTKCYNCGKELLSEWKFCPECGSEHKAISLLEMRKLAENGDCEAQFQLAHRYDLGDDENKDSKEAFNWYKKAAKIGHAEAQLNLAYCYMHGKGVELNLEEAEKWLRKSSEQGFDRAKCQLGCFVLNHKVNIQDKVKTYKLKDVREAISLLCEAANAGDACSQDVLGLIYAAGEFVEKNLEEAKRLFEAAAIQGYSDAQDHLGKWYCDKGKYFDAMWWYRHAAEQGHVEAQYDLAVCYAMSVDVFNKSKLTELKRLFETAINNGAEDKSNLKSFIEECESEEDDE